MALSARKILLTAGVIVAAAGSGTAVGLVAGHGSGAGAAASWRMAPASRAHVRPAGQGWIGCGTIPVTSTTGQTIGTDIGLLAADNTAIGGNWAAAEAVAAGRAGEQAAPGTGQDQAAPGTGQDQTAPAAAQGQAAPARAQDQAGPGAGRQRAALIGAQRRAIGDLSRILIDFSAAVGVRGQLASDVSTFYYAASHLTNGAPGWQLQSPVVESDLLTLAEECQFG